MSLEVTIGPSRSID